MGVYHRTAINNWQNYQRWLKNRNPKRAALEAKCGYDAKHAAHCLRLLHMGNEILSTGQVLVNRKSIDADYLLDIRQGKLPYDKLIEHVEAQLIQLETSYAISTLPHKPNFAKIENLAIELYHLHHG